MNRVKARQVGERIGVLSREAGMNQTQLAKKSGLTLAAVNRIIHGKRLPRLDSLTAIAEALDVPVETLLGPNDTEADALDEAVLLVVQRGDELSELQCRTLIEALARR